MMITCVLHSKTVAQRRGVETTVPTVIHTYNNMMGDVDQSDWMTSYPTERKRIKKWYKKRIMHLINISPQPAFTCSKLTIETLEQRCEICSKLTIKPPKRHQRRRFGGFIVNFEHIAHLFSSVSIVNFEDVIAG